MKIYSKILRKIRNNKDRTKKTIGIFTLGVGIRYGSINSSPINLPSNSTQQIQRVDNFVDEHTQDCKVQEGLSNKSSSRLTKTSSVVLIGNKLISKYSKSALEIRSGDLDKIGPGSRAKADARRNAQARKFSSGSTLIPGADGFVPRNTYCRYHENEPLLWKTGVKVSDAPFQGDGGNDQPPPENPKFDSSHYKGGPNPFIDKFDYDNPNHTRQTTDFSNKRKMNHSYDGHAEKCFGIEGNRNNENLKKFEKNVRDYIESPETERINGSYRYETPAYHYKKPDEDLIVTVNAMNNKYISVRNATDFQLEKLEIDGNLGYDSRPSMSLTLRLRGPKQ